MSSSTASSLDGLIGLRTAKRVVRELAAGKSGVHAVLLYGAPGSGKNVLADLLAQAWLCRHPGPDGADGTCRPCGAFGRGTNADFLRIEPSGRSAIIGVKAITNDNPGSEDPPTPLLTFFRTYPLMSRNKVALINSAERMNGTAANAILKTLEEPHPNAKLILTTESIGAILPTILSRCLAIACEAPCEEELRRFFPEATEDEMRMSEGTPGRLRHFVAHRQAYARIADFARSIATRSAGEALVASDGIREAAEGLEKSLGCTARAANAEVLELLAIFLAREPLAPPFWAQAATEAHRRVLQNGAPGIVFDALMVRMLRRAG